MLDSALGWSRLTALTRPKERKTEPLSYANLFHSSEEVALLASASIMELGSILKSYSLGKRWLGW